MTDPTTLLTLAERCEQAAGPDRELDVAIAFACGIVTHRQGNCFYTKNRYCSVMVLDYDYDDTEYRAPELPSYTASLDAAVTLVPEGWRYDLTNGDLVSKEKPAARLTPDFAGPCFDGYAQKVPLALCIAALRARAAAHD